MILALGPVVLPGALDVLAGYVWRDKRDLWHVYSIAFHAPFGPFGTRGDAEAEGVSTWVRAVDMTRTPRGGWHH